jgi:hypothetical protein
VRSPQPPLEYLVTCSQSSLEGFELARRDQIAKLRVELRDIHEEWVEAEVAARLSRLLLDGKRAESRADENTRPSLDSAASARQMSATPSLGAAFSGLAEKPPASLFRAEQRPSGDRGLFLSEEALPYPRHPEGVGLQPHPSRDIRTCTSPRQEPAKQVRAQPNTLVASNSTQEILRQSTSHCVGRPVPSVAGLQHSPAIEGLSFFPSTAACDALVSVRIRPSQQLPLFCSCENDRQTRGAYPTTTCEPKRVAIRIFVSGLAFSIPENLKTLEQCSRSRMGGFLPDQRCLVFSKSSPSQLRIHPLTAEHTATRSPKSASRFSRSKRSPRLVLASDGERVERPPTLPGRAKPDSRSRRLVFRILRGRTFQPVATIVRGQPMPTGTWFSTLRNLSLFRYQTSCPCLP